jgi:hypothetical protein
MRTFLLSFAISIVAFDTNASPLLTCQMMDRKGNSVRYVFAKPGDGTVREWRFVTAAGQVIEHPISNMPEWKAGWNDKNFWLVPVATPDYMLVATKLSRMNEEDFRQADAVVYKNNTALVSSGKCITQGTWKSEAAAVRPAPAPAVPQSPPSAAAMEAGGPVTAPSPIPTDGTGILGY